MSDHSLTIPASAIEVIPPAVALSEIQTQLVDVFHAVPERLPFGLRVSVAFRTLVRALEVRCGHPVLIVACKIHEASEDDIARWEDDGGAL